MNVNFTVFIDKILNGEKRQTIRKAGPKWAKVKVGDKLTLYTGLRTKQCRKLGEAEVESIEDVEIESRKYMKTAFRGDVLRNGNLQTKEDTLALANADGFKQGYDFFDFFHSHYGEIFKGKIIKWKNFRKAENE
jgi:hypothetical protein